ncbi:hypothetical protein [Wielerella bovis]|nr:hypothetical protein [Wielerella bovis]MCG7657161.1 hypothetical protein [Wielerella bovis]MCG7659384.1 hypothetical protein [Wielerella bovis]
MYQDDSALMQQAQCEQQEYEYWFANRFNVPLPPPEITDDDLRAFFPNQF